MNSTSLTISFDGIENKAEEVSKPDVFSPSVFPWLYDPTGPNNYINAIDSCDKWVLLPWQGFGFHELAIEYRDSITESAKKRLPKLYEEAKKQYDKDLISFINSQLAKSVASSTKKITEYSSDKEYKFDLILGTELLGKVNSTTYSGTEKPNTSLEIFFDPEADATEKDDKEGNKGDQGKQCSILDWRLFYTGNPEWSIADNEVYYQWKDKGIVDIATVQNNFKIWGAPATNNDAAMSVVKVRNKHNEFVPFYCYYDTRANDDKYPTPYAMHDLRFNWDTIVTSTQTLEVYDLFRLWYESEVINPIPVEPYRVSNPVPEKFPAYIKSHKVTMNLALGYVPPSGIYEGKTSNRVGTTIDISKSLKYHDQKEGDTEGGRLEVLPFDFSQILGSAFIRNSGLLESHWSQDGEHNLEIINLGTEARIEYNDKKRAGKTEAKYKRIDSTYYVPSLDTGEYLYKKRFQVVNPWPTNGANSYVTIRYVKSYGKIGTKVVFDVMNPFDRDMLFAIQTGLTTTQGIDIRDGTEQTDLLVFIPKGTTRAPTTKLFTAYVNTDYIEFTFISYMFAPDIELQASTVTGFNSIYSPTDTRSVGLARANWRLKDKIKAWSDNICKLPLFPIFIANNAFKPNTPNYLIPDLSAVGVRVVYGDNNNVPSSQQSLSSGAFAMINLSQYYWIDPDDASKSEEKDGVGNVLGFTRVFSKAFADKIGYTGSWTGVAYISPDIESVFQVNRVSAVRDTNFTWNHFRTNSDGSSTGEVLLLAGASNTFCQKNDKLSTFKVEMAEQFDKLHIYPPRQIYRSDAYNNQSLVPQEPQEALPTGAKYWIATGMQVIPGIEPWVECQMVGRVVFGWDNTSIMVNFPSSQYKP